MFFLVVANSGLIQGTGEGGVGSDTERTEWRLFIGLEIVILISTNQKKNQFGFNQLETVLSGGVSEKITTLIGINWTPPHN